MSREIKFRVWSENINKYVGGMVISQSGRLYGMSLGFELGEEKAKDYVIEQYAGLKDKNGMEIYEGDILLAVDANAANLEAYDVVEWTEEYGGTGFYPFVIDGYGEVMERASNVEVVGNIHENPELLEEEK